MNIRISTNEFKVRLSLDEVTRLKDQGTISGNFPVGPNAQFDVTLVVGGKVLSAHQNSRGLDIEVPEEAVQRLLSAKNKKECEIRESLYWGNAHETLLAVEIDAFTLK